MTTDTPHVTPSPAASKAEPGVDLKSAPMPELEKQLGYSPEGLSKAEATRRLAQYGPNEIAEHKTNPLLKFLSYFWGPIPWMIEIAVVLSGAVGHCHRALAADAGRRRNPFDTESSQLLAVIPETKNPQRTQVTSNAHR